MKKISTELFELIKTLNRSEKRYFQQFANRHTIKGKNIYYELFQLINQQEMYDETAIKSHFENRKASHNFAVVKKQLYEQLLMALHQYHQVHSIHEKIKRDVHITQILLKKQLFQQANKRIKRIEKDITAFGLFEYTIPLIDLKYQLATKEAFKKTSIEDLESYHTALNSAIQHIEKLGKVRHISHVFQATHYKKINVDTAQSQEVLFLKEAIYHGENHKLELERLRGLATYYFMTGQPKEAALTNIQLLKWFENNPKQLLLYSEIYISIFNNYLIDNLRLRHFEALQEGLNKLEQLQYERPFKQITGLSTRMAHQRFMIELNWLISIGDFQKSKTVMPKLEIFLRKNQSNIQNIHQITFYYLIAYCHFALANYDTALIYLNKILSFKENIISEIIEFTRLLYLLTHFELGNETLLESLIVNSRRWLKTRRELYKIESLIFSHLRKWLNAVNKKEQQAIWESLWDALQTLINDPRERRVLNYFNVTAWAQAKKDNIQYDKAYQMLLV